MPHPIIYINSWPGVGKHTIAKTLETLMKGRARVVHNHLHIDLAGAILPRSSQDYPALRHALRQLLFKTLTTSSDTYDDTFIFTDFQTSNDSGTSTAREYATAARMRGCTFVPVILTCEMAENERRMRSKERVELVAGGKGMLLDVEMLRDVRRRRDVHEFGIKEELIMDVTELEPVEAAAEILEHVRAVAWELETLMSE
ncbi:hypothetical protein P7C71_g3310, partial [Lecanoromycetidae sp. Uapishka_2]